MTATNESFDDLLKRYTPWDLHFDTLKRHNWFVNWVPKKTDWKGGTMEVPLEVGQAGSFSWGALTDEDDIGEDSYLMGTLTNSDLKELWGTMKFHNKDLKRHNSLEESYLKILPSRMNRFSEYMSEIVSITYFGDGSIDKATSTGGSGTITVNYPNRFNIGQKIVVDDDNSNAVSGYIRSINVNTKTLTVYDARTGGSLVPLTDYTVAQNAKIYMPGQGDVPQGLKSILLPASAGGSTNYFGYEKALYPVLQAYSIDGSAFTKATILDDLYNAYYQVLAHGKGSMDKIMVIPLPWMQYISAQLSGNVRYTMESKSIAYGVTKVSLSGVDGKAEFIAIRDCDPTCVFILDKQGIHLCGNNFFKRDTDANGQEFYVKRTTAGRVNIVDTAFEAALVVMPGAQGIIHSIPNPLV